MKTFWMIAFCGACFISGIILGNLLPYQTKGPPPLVIIDEEIHLKIPKGPQDVKKQLLHLAAQKSMLEEWIRWEEKGKKK